ncbi:L10-interacting MYB domain-containing protein-like [Aegilops tauschii subsp. strangulata]|uniref:Myb/SANT-like domain-containing protein n=1 Tax=Aegilops tauschii subsp. strangulata TaxID=200361 RepID=A0A453NJW3_AEGTS|nr:L10-interacting MYB domain-containing protein-like [Aegilops tauschii subsp. strangulata]
MVAEWNIENTRIVTELFVKQVRAGNRPNTHLTSNAYDEVGREFKLITGLEYINDQLKNKWDKLRGEYSIFKKLKLKETGAGWDIERNTVKQDAEWWKKAKIDIPGCYKFRKHGLRNEENLRIMFEDITSDGSDHWNPTSGIPPTSTALISSAINLEQIEDVDLLEDTQETPSPVTPKVNKRLGKIICDTNKKPKTAQVMQEQITVIGDICKESHSTFQSFFKHDDTTSVASVMKEAIPCGAIEGSDEHFIATELFIKREQREIFLSMSAETRLGWLKRKFSVKYGN